MEQEAEVTQFLEAVAKAKQVDLEAWEFCLRKAVLAAGARILEGVLAQIGSGRREEPVMCGCGVKMESEGVREKTIRTILGPVRLRRSLFVCPDCGVSRIPGDELLNVEQTEFSPGARRLMTHAGSRTSFIEAEEDLRLYGNLQVDRKDVERVAEATGDEITGWMAEQDKQILKVTPQEGSQPPQKDIPVLYIAFDGTGIPMRRGELEGHKGKGPDGVAKTREVKLGCVFTQVSVDEEGRPVREPNSTTYVGAIEDSDAFGWRLYAEAVRRGLERAKHVVALTDGAAYNKSIVQMHFPGATHVIDLYHGREHVCGLSKLLLEEAERKEEDPIWIKLLDAGKIEVLIERIQKYVPKSGQIYEKAHSGIEYLRQNAPCMRYAEFQKQGLFVGSGVIEAGCRTVIAQRLKKSGMFWSLGGANAIIAARCCLFSRRFEDFWEARAA